MLKTCPECGKKMSSAAKTCPACGYAPGKAAAFWLKLVGGLMVFGGAVAALWTGIGEGSPLLGGVGALGFVAGMIVFVVGRFKE